MISLNKQEVGLVKEVLNFYLEEDQISKTNRVIAHGILARVGMAQDDDFEPYEDNRHEDVL